MKKNQTISDTAKSIKRKLPDKPKGTRYSDNDLMEFKELILKKIEESKLELKYYQDAIMHYNEHGTDDTVSSFKSFEDSSLNQEKEYLHQMAERQRIYIDNLEKALIRIENKTYGICRATGNLIRKDRLRSVPHATLSIEAKLNQH